MDVAKRKANMKKIVLLAITIFFSFLFATKSSAQIMKWRGFGVEVTDVRLVDFVQFDFARILRQQTSF